MSPESRAPHLLRLDPDNLPRDLSRPDVVALLAAGWTMGPAFVLKDAEGAFLAVILLPPPPALEGVIESRLPMGVYVAVAGSVLSLAGVIALAFML